MGLHGAVSQDNIASLSGIALFIIAILLVNSLLKAWIATFKLKYFQDSAFTVLIGVLAGGVLVFTGHMQVIIEMQDSFANLFFVVLLSPIIFESAYTLQKKPFVANLGSSLVYAFLGTFIATVMTAAIILILGRLHYTYELSFFESAAFGALISATDTVAVLVVLKAVRAHETLTHLIIGESVFNDAVTIIMYQTVITAAKAEGVTPAQNALYSVAGFVYLFVSSLVMGVAVGLFTAYLLKVTREKAMLEKIKGEQLLHLSIMIASPIISYLTAQAFQLSGIVSLFLTGVVLSQYGSGNLHNKSKVVLKFLFGSISGICESTVFIYLGLSVYVYYPYFVKAGYGLMIWSIVAIHVARYGNVLFCSFLNNFSRVRQPVTCKFQIVMGLSGMRGSIAYILSLKCSEDLKEGSGGVVVFVTIWIAMFTLFVEGTVIGPIISLLDVSERPKDKNEVRVIEKGCCEELKKSVAVFDHDYMQKYFMISLEERRASDFYAEMLDEDFPVKVKASSNDLNKLITNYF